jgi:DNA repair exonuclease SbcCD ATPase subunit
VLQKGEDVEVDVQLTAVGAQAVEDNQDLKNELAKLTMQIHAMEEAAEAKRQAEVEKEERIAKLEDQVRELSERLDSPGSTDSTQALDTKIADLQSENDGLLGRLTGTSGDHTTPPTCQPTNSPTKPNRTEPVTTDSYRDLETDHKKLQERLDGVIRALDEVIA